MLHKILIRDPFWGFCVETVEKEEFDKRIVQLMEKSDVVIDDSDVARIKYFVRGALVACVVDADVWEEFEKQGGIEID